MRIVGLDLANATGVAFGDSRDATPYLWTEKLNTGGVHHGQRFAQMMHLVKSLIVDYQPVLVAIEKPIAAGVIGGEARVQLAMGYRASVYAVCSLNNVRFTEYEIPAIRGHFIGDTKLPRGVAKERVFQRCQMLGWPAENDNESDAAAVWDYARGLNCGVGTLPNEGLFGDADTSKRQQVGTNK